MMGFYFVDLCGLSSIAEIQHQYAMYGLLFD
jgi:hypothetical protein